MISTGFDDRIGKAVVAAGKEVVPVSLYKAEKGEYQ